MYITIPTKKSAFTRTTTNSISHSAQTARSTQTIRDQSPQVTVPWDYKIDEHTVGDLINGDMALLPDNQLLPNDDNYATDDKIMTLSYMNATMSTDSSGQTKITLSPWKLIKSYKLKETAEKDLMNLKTQIETEVDLIGVYKTEKNGKFRHFAVISLPTGNDIKQPVSEERYNLFKDKKKVKVTLEEVHSFEDYDQTMAKFRRWNE